MADKIILPSRAELVRRYERDYLLRNPGAKIGETTMPGIDARVFADQLLPLYAEAARFGGGSDLANLTGTDLEDEAEDLGLTRRLEAAGATGAVIIGAPTGAVTLLAGLQCRNKATGHKYAVVVAGLYADGDQVSIQAIEPGPLTDVDAEAVLEWLTPPPGLDVTCTVATQADGSGLSGGRAEEEDEEIRERIRTERKTPALAGNSADYRKAALATPNIGIQAAFTFPAVLGPGTIGLAFTMRPSTTGGDRRPNGTQIALVQAHVIGQMPYDDGLFMYSLLDDPVDLDLRVRWRRGSASWTDAYPWPPYDGVAPYKVTAASSSTVFSLATTAGSPTPPRVGQTLAFWDKPNQQFVRKRVLSFTGNGSIGTPWVITCDQTNGISDTSFTPAVNDRPCPWSDSLVDLVAPLLAEFDKLGPSDHSSFDLGGLRRRREPTGFESYPSELSGRIVVPLYSVTSVDDVQVASPTLPRAAPLGTPGATAYLTSLKSLRAFAL